MTNRLPETCEDPKVLRTFLHHLHNTLVLLGADIRFAQALNDPGAISEADIAELRNYNVQLINATKGKLVQLHKTALVRGD